MSDSGLPRMMTGAELASMLKSSVNFKSLGGMRSPVLTLPGSKKQWWRDCKVGMFIHWGLYSILGRGEWVRFNEQIPDEEYEALTERFDGSGCDMREWVSLAKDMGARYMVMVARHHDGFSLWDSPGSYKAFTSMNSAAHRDFIREYTDACHEAGLYTGIYYSNMDWRFPGYFDPEGKPESALRMKQQAYDQVRELCSRYGKVDILWYDGSWLAHKGSDTSAAWLWEPIKLNTMARSYNPDMLINPRSGWEGDFYCDEGSHEVKGSIIPVPWEKSMCICSGTSWGWIPNDPPLSLDRLITMLVNVIARDGNLLLNIGPRGDGSIPEEVAARAREFGAWLKENGEAVYGTRGGPVQPVDRVFGTTYHDNTIYFHILDRGAFQALGPVRMPFGMAENSVESVSIHGIPVDFAQEADTLSWEFPQGLREETDTIVTVRLSAPVRTADDPEIYFTGKE
ncbi:MAG: alpha-L-fucosidase [Firmicutes bacterium]|nr:alpha-L-fucosidase [Bacillota bacterium]